MSEAAVRCALATLEVTELPARLAAAAAADPEVSAIAAGRAEPAGDWPAELPRLVVVRVGEDLLRTMAPGSRFRYATAPVAPVQPIGPDWLGAHAAVVLGAVRAAARLRAWDLSAALATAVWPVAPADTGLDWARAVAKWGAEAAVAARDRRAFVRLLAAGAAWFADRGDFLTAEAFGVRELAARERLGDPAGLADVLTRRGHVYRRWGRLHRAMDCYRRLLVVEQGREDPLGTARALALFGTVLLDARRTAPALAHLERAVGVFAGLGRPVEHARALVALGTALWRDDNPRLARRRLSEALALLVDHDERGAAEVRALLADPDRLLG
ncbi:hypothetical protein Acsp05_70710 [Actinokineospora sp. NBRC 105648]|nr:hypothetical protein Acsp05_70710 [Actinokineospora sp. NBRC 105648]